MKHIPRKRFGQHFLADAGIVDAIVDAIDPRPGQVMVEIGPGLAALTQPLLERLGHLTVIELDRDLAARLSSRPGLTVIQSDVLKVDFSELASSLGSAGFAVGPPQGETAPSGGSAVREATSVGASKVRVVGNLPYNISTPILFHLLDFVDVIQDQHFMLQKEVVDRMVARPATAEYGRLSVMLQWRYAMDMVLFVPPESFNPPPRVDSAVVRMVPHTDPASIEGKLLSEIVRVAFSQRRKLLRHTLGKWLQEKAYGGEFDVQRRAEEVPVAEYLALAASL
jgi:16S rRNA (adenine1518-N6/adenine1519-N6)-dimethyltransferase